MTSVDRKSSSRSNSLQYSARRDTRSSSAAASPSPSPSPSPQVTRARSTSSPALKTQLVDPAAISSFSSSSNGNTSSTPSAPLTSFAPPPLAPSPPSPPPSQANGTNGELRYVVNTKSSTGGGGGGGKGSSSASTPSERENSGRSNLLFGEIPDPIPKLEISISEADIRESAYELLVGVNGPRENLRVRGANGGVGGGGGGAVPKVNVPQETTSSRFRMAFGLSRKEEGSAPEIANAQNSVAGPTTMEIICRQMGISDFSDSRIRNALSRASASQVGKKLENLIAPLELLQYLGPTDFASQRDYVRWKKRQLSLLEQGLLKSGNRGGGKAGGTDTGGDKLLDILNKLKSGELDLQEAKAKQLLRVAVLNKAETAGKTFELRSSTIRWADGFYLNIHLYMAMLGAVFKSAEEATLIDEAEELLEQIRKSWPVLGITTVLHHLTFSWVLFRQFVKTGKSDVNLVSACVAQVREAIRLFFENRKGDNSEDQSPVETNLLKTIFGNIQGFAEKHLFTYHDAFPHGARGVMEQLVALSLFSEDILQSEEVSGYKSQNRKRGTKPAHDKAETYIRSSLKTAFAQLHEQAASRRRSYKGSAPPVLVSLAVDAGELAEDSVSLYSPCFSEWYPSAAGLAAAQVHGCYRRELKVFLGETTVLTQEAAQVLLAADKLEKQLVQMAVEDSTECEDGGAAAIQEMASSPFETEKTMQSLLQKWVEDRLAKFGEWVDRMVELEKWDPNALKDHYAPSAVDVMKLLNETLDSFFELPLPPDSEILVRLARGMEGALDRYCKKTISIVGPKEQFLPSFPPLTRYKRDIHMKVQQHLALQAQQNPKKPGGGGGAPSTNGKSTAPSKMEGISLPRLCCRINTLLFCSKQLDDLRNQIQTGWENALSPPIPSPSKTSSKPKASVVSLFKATKDTGVNIPLAPPLPSELLSMFDELREELEKGLNQLCEFAAFKVVFNDMKAVVMEGLYIGNVQRARITTVIDALRPHLISIVDHISPSMRDRLVAALLRALVVAFLRVLLAAGPNRCYTLGDAKLLEEDLELLKDLFVDGGEGLPEADVQKATSLPSKILTLFSVDTEGLIKNFEAANKEGQKTQNPALVPGKQLKLPPMKAWSPTDANTIMRVLCYRADRKGSKLLKKYFDLPKELRR